MSRVFITGSTDGLGLMAARLLLEEGHQVVLHARDTRRPWRPGRYGPGPSNSGVACRKQ
jgi:NAD(P)-dependent dehydrogenase (short-subunit alcohol dehydrogenase family)